jgi:hypothetical protein
MTSLPDRVRPRGEYRRPRILAAGQRDDGAAAVPAPRSSRPSPRRTGRQLRWSRRRAPPGWTNSSGFSVPRGASWHSLATPGPTSAAGSGSSNRVTAGTARRGKRGPGDPRHRRRAMALSHSDRRARQALALRHKGRRQADPGAAHRSQRTLRHRGLSIDRAAWLRVQGPQRRPALWNTCRNSSAIPAKRTCSIGRPRRGPWRQGLTRPRALSRLLLQYPEAPGPRPRPTAPTTTSPAAGCWAASPRWRLRRNTATRGSWPLRSTRAAAS